MKKFTREENIEIKDPQKGDLTSLLTSKNLKIRNHVAGLLGLKIPGVEYKNLEFYVEKIHDLEKKSKKARTAFRISLVKKDIIVKVLFTETDDELEVYFYYPYKEQELPYIEYADSIKPLLPKIKKIFDKKIDTTILKQKVLERIRLYVKAKNENSELD